MPALVMHRRAGQATFALFTLFTLLVVTAGGLLASRGNILLALGAVLASAFALLVVRSARARLLAAAGGALLVFQAPGDAGKIVYVGLLLLCLAVALTNLLRDDSGSTRLFFPMLAMALVVVALLAASFVISHTNGIGFIDWFRDALSYILLVILPIVGLEAARHVSRKFLRQVLMLLGLVAAIGFALDWLSRRGAAGNLGRVVLATATFTILAIIVAAIRAATGPHRAVWFAALILMTGALLVTGTRTNLALIAVALIGVAGSHKRGAVRPSSLVVLVALTTAGTGAAIVLLGNALITQQDFLAQRIDVLTQALNGGLTRDQSYIIREASYRIAQTRWQAAPWLGNGPGHVYSTSGLYTLDTPWVVPAKFGVLGTAVLMVYLLTIGHGVRKLRATLDVPSWEFVAARSWAFVVVVLTPFGPWVEDKGTGLALMIIIAMTVSAARSPERSDGATGLETKTVAKPVLRPM